MKVKTGGDVRSLQKGTILDDTRDDVKQLLASRTMLYQLLMYSPLACSIQIRVHEMQHLISFGTVSFL